MRQRDCRKAAHPHTNVSKGRLLGRAANARGGAECGAPTARGRAVCGKTACTVLRGEAGNGVGSWGAPSLQGTAWTAPDLTTTAPASYSTRLTMPQVLWMAIPHAIRESTQVSRPLLVGPGAGLPGGEGGIRTLEGGKPYA